VFRFRRSAVAVLTATGCVTSAAVAASASVPWPDAPAKVRVVTITHSSFTIAAKKAAHASKYRLFASPSISDVSYANLTRTRSARKTATAKRPKLTIKGLHYTTAVYYYRFQTVNGPHFKVSPIYQLNLAPSVPTAFALAKGAPGISVTWTSGDALGFTLVQATDRALSKGRRVYSIGPRTNQFTPYGLRAGTTYYFRIRAKNGKTPSAYSPTILSAPATAHEQNLRVLTYNLLQSRWDGTKEGGSTIAPWNTQRKFPAAALVKGADPDVIAIQEGQGPIRGDVLQVDTLRALLGADYSLADTETGDTHRSGNYVIFRDTTYRQIAGQGGHWSIGDDQYPAYQVLENRASGARFLFVSVHLHQGAQSWNTKHGKEMRSLLNQAHAAAARYTNLRTGDLPIIYAGDFNSYYKLAMGKFDAPGVEMRADHIADAINVAQSHSNVSYNSENGYTRTPPQNGGSIDRIAGEPGVAMHSWAELLKLSKGRFAGVIPSDHNPVTANMSFAYP
jgi:endonuclease/exonuclease/phosphatase family metal-dependent hydrolase